MLLDRFVGSVAEVHVGSVLGVGKRKRGVREDIVKPCLSFHFCTGKDKNSQNSLIGASTECWQWI